MTQDTGGEDRIGRKTVLTGEVFRIKDIGSNTTRTIIGLALGVRGIRKD